VFVTALYGVKLYQEVEITGQMESDCIVLILSNGGWKYLSTGFWEKRGAQ